jgi:hypothetical protein
LLVSDMNSAPSHHRALTIAARIALAFLLVGSSASVGAAEDLKPLFDGKSLAGWVQRGGQAKYEAADGCVVGTTVAGTPNSFLCTEKTYGDFILELEVKADPGLNSGVQIRSECFDRPTAVEHGTRQLKIPAGRVHGYQVEVDQSDTRRWSGGLYDEGRRAWLFPLDKNKEAGAAYRIGEWNQYRIICEGDSLRTWVNGVPAADLVDSMTLSGLIGLQVHSAKQPGMQVRWRNLRLQDLGRHAWRPLWDGKTLNGWHVIGKGNWKIEDGAIHATHTQDVQEFGHFVTDATYSDFTVRLKYKSIKGNSGLYFRIEETGFSGVSGFQAEIDAERDAGGLYETNGRAWVSQPKPDDVKKWFRPQEWNTMTVSAHGRRVVVNVNGHRTAELRDDPGRLEGRLALQVHGGQDCEVWFKDIELLVKAP